LSLMPSVLAMIDSSELYAVKLETAMLKDLEVAAAKTGKVQRRKKTGVKPPDSLYETACLLFIQNMGLAKLMESLPYGGMHTDRRFAAPLFLCLSEIFRKWVHDAATAAMLQSKNVLSKATSLRFIVVLVDEDSEVHRFVASGVCAFRKCAQKKLSELEKTLEKREKQFCPPKRRQDKRMRQLKSSL
jgi:hypothetical protein